LRLSTFIKEFYDDDDDDDDVCGDANSMVTQGARLVANSEERAFVTYCLKHA